jgi:hypothetical protein
VSEEQREPWATPGLGVTHQWEIARVCGKSEVSVDGRAELLTDLEPVGGDPALGNSCR